MFLQGTINYYNINARANVIEANAFRRKKNICKDWSNNVKKAEVYNILTGQYQSSSALLRKTTTTTVK